MKKKQVIKKYKAVKSTQNIQEMNTNDCLHLGREYIHYKDMIHIFVK